MFGRGPWRLEPWKSSVIVRKPTNPQEVCLNFLIRSISIESSTITMHHICHHRLFEFNVSKTPIGCSTNHFSWKFAVTNYSKEKNVSQNEEITNMQNNKNMKYLKMLYIINVSLCSFQLLLFLVMPFGGPLSIFHLMKDGMFSAQSGFRVIPTNEMYYPNNIYVQYLGLFNRICTTGYFIS